MSFEITLADMQEMFDHYEDQMKRVHKCSECGTPQVQLISDEQQRCRHCKHVEPLTPKEDVLYAGNKECIACGTRIPLLGPKFCMQCDDIISDEFTLANEEAILYDALNGRR